MRLASELDFGFGGYGGFGIGKMQFWISVWGEIYALLWVYVGIFNDSI